MAKWGMVIDLAKCTGCQACTAACAMENTRLPNESWQDVVFYTDGQYPSGSLSWLPRPCMHCENASCVAVCPTRATYKDKDGFVLIDWNKCIGCKYCIIACPYGVRFFADEKQAIQPDIRSAFPGKDGKSWDPPYQMPAEKQDWKHGVGVAPSAVVSKCTFCYHRVSTAPAGTPDLDPADPALREHTPACVVACPPTARYFGDLSIPDSEVNKMIADQRGSRLFEHTGNRPQVYYLTGDGGPIPGTRKSREQL